MEDQQESWRLSSWKKTKKDFYPLQQTFHLPNCISSVKTPPWHCYFQNLVQQGVKITFKKYSNLINYKIVLLGSRLGTMLKKKNKNGYMPYVSLQFYLDVDLFMYV